MVQVSGALCVPLWVFLIDRLGFQIAALSVAVVAAGVVVFLSARYFNAAPASLGLAPDGDGAFGSVSKPRPISVRDCSNAEVPDAVGGICAGTVRANRTAFAFDRPADARCRRGKRGHARQRGDDMRRGGARPGWLVDRGSRPPIAAAVNFTIQIVGVLLLIIGNGWVSLTLGCVLFGLGIGNLTSLPPLIVQKEFNREDVVTVVALIVAINQAVFAFAPAIVGVFRDATANYVLPFAMVACVQFLATVIVLLGRGATASPKTSG